MCEHARLRSFATAAANAEAAKAEKRLAAEADKAEMDRIAEVNPEEERLAAAEPEMRPLPVKTSGIRDGYRKRKEKERRL